MNKHYRPTPVATSPIPLSLEDIREVQEMHFKEYGEKISPDQARTEAIQVLLSIKAIFKAIPKEKLVANSASVEYGVLRGDGMK